MRKIPSPGHILQVLKIVAMNAPLEGIIEPGLRWLSQELSEAENMPLARIIRLPTARRISNVSIPIRN